MLDLEIECLRIELRDVAGYEHRLGAIAERAATLFAEQLGIRFGSGEYPATEVARIGAPSVSLDLRTTTDEEASRAVADAWLEAVTLRLGH